MRSRIEPMKKIARTLRSHRALILNYFRARKQFSSGVVGSRNNNAKLTMRKSYGFRTFHVTKIALYHALGKMPDPRHAEILLTRPNLKGDLAIRPIVHQEERRVEAHIFIAFLAYCLQITLQRRLHALAPGLTARSALEKFAAVQMIDVHLPTTDGRELLLTRYTQPEPELRLLIQQLNSSCHHSHHRGSPQPASPATCCSADLSGQPVDCNQSTKTG